MLSRPFVEFFLWGWDILPRIVLMYYANFLSLPEGYFYTDICNEGEFRNTIVSHDFHFISWDNLPKQHLNFLTMDHFQRIVDSNAHFGRKFGRNEPVLYKIDSELWDWYAKGFSSCEWFNNQEVPNVTIQDYIITNTTKLKSGRGIERLKHLIIGLLTVQDFHTKQCTWHLRLSKVTTIK